MAELFRSREAARSAPLAPRDRFEALYRRHLPKVLSYARRRLPTQEAAEEAAAETFMVAWRRLEEVPEPALPWLYGVARRLIANQRRSERRREALVDALGGEASRASFGLVPDSISAVDQDLDGELMGVLQELTADEREAVTLVAWEELGYRDAAAAMGLSESAFSRRLQRARKRLRRSLAGHTAQECRTDDEQPTEEAGAT